MDVSSTTRSVSDERLMKGKMNGMKKNLCWIRRDLRLHDHHALARALEEGETTLVFVFDSHILGKLKDSADKRVTFIHQSLVEIEEALQKKGSSLIIRYGKPEEEIPLLAGELGVSAVFCNRDYEPYAKKRDALVKLALEKIDIRFEQFKDSVMFEGSEIETGSGTPYKVYTPYKNSWLERFNESQKSVPEYNPSLKNLRSFKNPENILDHDWMKVIGFEPSLVRLPGGSTEGKKRLKNFVSLLSDYKKNRDFPAIEGTSLISVHIRHGTISVRDLVRTSLEEKSEGARTWLQELIWREFYAMVLDRNPRVTEEAFRTEYDQIKWPGTEEHFKKWCEGQTGVPIVDAAMRCFRDTGMMHNRLRMVVASYLVKILLVDWRKGEEYFAEKLLDFDLASNNGNWQWSAGTGCDAQPYFRIFNPYSQSKKFDPDGEFIRVWCPELQGLSKKDIHRPEDVEGYPEPLVSYEMNRLKALKLYKSVKKGK